MSLKKKDILDGPLVLAIMDGITLSLFSFSHIFIFDIGS